MDVFQAALLVGALIAAALSWREPRGLMWILAGATSFLVTALYEGAGLPWHPVVTGFFDAAVCLAIYFAAAFRWELWLYRIFQASVFISLLRAAGGIDSHYTYVVALELCSWAALLVIGGTAAGGWVDARMGSGLPAGSRLHRFVTALRSARSSPPFSSD